MDEENDADIEISTPTTDLSLAEEETVSLYLALYNNSVHAVTGKNGGELVQFIEHVCACCVGLKWIARKGLEGRGVSGEESFEFVEKVAEQTFTKFLTFLCKQIPPARVHLLYRDAVETEADRASFPFPKEFVNPNPEGTYKRKKY